MFLGHVAVAFAAKRAAPRTSLTTLIFAVSALDVLFPLFLWLGIESVRLRPGTTPFTRLDLDNYPYSHSLLLALAWSALFAWAYLWRTRYARGALIVGLGVLSHWVLDLVSHTPDMPLAPGGGSRLGLGLWNSTWGTVLVEVAMFVVGVGLYLRTTRARGWAGHLSLWFMVALLALLYAADVLGPPPPDPQVMRVVGLAYPLLLLLFIWVDRTRELRAGPPIHGTGAAVKP